MNNRKSLFLTILVIAIISVFVVYKHNEKLRNEEEKIYLQEQEQKEKEREKEREQKEIERQKETDYYENETTVKQFFLEWMNLYYPDWSIDNIYVEKYNERIYDVRFYTINPHFNYEFIKPQKEVIVVRLKYNYNYEYTFETIRGVLY